MSQRVELLNMRNILQNISTQHNATLNKLESFKIKARHIHGCKYNYEYVFFTHTADKVVIICPMHGEFEQTVSDHLSGRGCKKCGYNWRASKLRKSLDTFVQEAKLIHSDKYDYSKAVYINNSSKIQIVCKIHGVFMQTPSDHLRGRGCRKCGSIKSASYKKSDNDSFFIDAIKVHGTQYDYSRVVYQTAIIPIEIICLQHGSFYQTPNSHLGGSGCEICGRDRAAKSRLKTVGEFINQATSIHNGKYDYSLTVYIKSNEAVTIICPKHGEFEQTPQNHLVGGCIKCGFDRTAECQRIPLHDFFTKAITVHGGKYTYNLNGYKNATDKISIICPIHGEFMQIGTEHLKGRGCKKCSVNGPNNPNWNPNLTEDERRQKRSGHQTWSKCVRQNYSYTCKKCGYIGKQKPRDTVAHHIESHHDNLELRLELSNGVCLCNDCHIKFHRLYGRNNTRQQFEKFLVSN